jgi:hypothetical protein
MATERKRLFTDHKKVGSKLIPPFKAQLNVEEVSYSRLAQPEMIWLRLLSMNLGEKWTGDFTVAMTQALGRITGDAPWLLGISDFGTLSTGVGAALRVELEAQGLLWMAQGELQGLVGLYPECPLRVLFDAHPILVNREHELDRLKRAFRETRDKSSREATIMQGHVVYLGFVSRKLHIVKGATGFDDFPELERYPDTEKSRRVAASVRASINAFFGPLDGPDDSRRKWPGYFRRRSLELEPLDLSGLD